MLSGRTVLIVEAQYLIALDLQNTLEDLAPGNVIIAQDARHAQELAAEWDDCRLAIVEVERELPEHIALVGELVRRGIPVIGVTADADLPQQLSWFPATPILLKPVPSESILSVLAGLFDSQKE